MSNKQIGLNITAYEKLQEFIGKLTIVEKIHITASDAIILLVDFYTARTDNDSKAPAGGQSS